MKETMIYRIGYNKKEDAFQTFVYVGTKRCPDWEDFGLELSCKCFPAWIEETQSPTEEKNMVHYEILTHIRQALRLGYKIEYIDIPESD